MLKTLQAFEKCTIGASDGDVGHVNDLYFDDHTWAVRYLIVRTGSWLAGRKVLVSPMAIQQMDWPGHRLVADITQEQVRNSPDIDTEQPVVRQHELQYLGYYGYPTYWDGGGLWGVGMFPFALAAGQGTLPLGEEARERAIAAEDAQRERHRRDDPHLRSCEAILGYHIHASDGDVGHVDGFLVDDETWAIRYLVVNTSNWWLGQQVLIAPQWIDEVRWADQSVTVALSRNEVKTSPHYDPAVEMDRQHETSLYSHYGRPSYWQPGATLEREI